MYYLEYHELLKKYKEAEKTYYDALDKKSKLLYNVTPHSIEIKEVVNHLSNSYSDDKLINYASEIFEVDNLINSSRNNKDVLEYELKKKYIQLKASNDKYDKIYFYKWIEHKSVYKFYKLIGYSVRQTYNLIKEMKVNLYGNK